MKAEDLKRYCAASGSTRVNIEAPWSTGGHTYATNGHLIVRIPRLADVPENPNAPDIGKLFPYANPTEWFALADIVLPKTKKADCPECNGDGNFRHEDCPDCEGHKCDNCEGAGKIHKMISHKIGLCLFDLKYLLLLKDLPNCKIGPGGELEPAPFQFGGGDGLLMPRRY